MPTARPRLERDFFTREDVLAVSRDLLGQHLVSEWAGVRTVGRIVEVEAYRGRDDKACHAFGNRRTPRTDVMFGQGGHAYVYLCYGIHHLFNIVTSVEGEADAVLVRALEPLSNPEAMLRRRKMAKMERRLTAGPGVLAQAMGITTALSGLDLTRADSPVWLEQGQALPAPESILRSPRIGVDYAGDCADWPWRFSIKNNPWVSVRAT